MSDRFIDKVARRLKLVIEWKYFDAVSGTVSLANPVAMAPQLWATIVSDNVEAVSVGMWWLFVAIQTTLALVGVKSRNLGLFISMVISILMSISIIAIVWLK
ncbi:MAG: hypothetical protein ABIA47_01520 [bacterium]